MCNAKYETFTDPRDGRVYKTVKIGNQVWMAENLNYDAPGSKFYDNDPKNGEIYGRLYDWETAKKACPPGWHLPSDDEWGVLNFFVGKEANKHLKAKIGWNDYEGESCNGMDTYGFAALPGGVDVGSGNFESAGDIGCWWSANEINNSNLANIRSMFRMSTMDDDSFLFSLFDLKSDLLSVRCLQDGCSMGG